MERGSRDARSPRARLRKPLPLYRATDYRREMAGPGSGSDERAPYRSDFRRDYGRLIHCAAFRRLIGKTQLFPGVDSDFFRTRITHSLEVAQIAKSIAIKLNAQEPFLRRSGGIDTDLVEVAGLAHDLGHPPFGHNGEIALDYCMRRYGGFEGNAQTLRILARLEKKATTDPLRCGITDDGRDVRFGLDLCVRTLAAVLKYNRPIPWIRPSRGATKLRKGYYRSEYELVQSIKAAVTGRRHFTGEFKTLECWIMDVADDIAYSTYDLEDAFKVGFMTPIDLLASTNTVLDEVGRKVSEQVNRRISRDMVRAVLLTEFGQVIADAELGSAIKTGRKITYDDLIDLVMRSYQASRDTADIGYARTHLTSTLVSHFIDGVTFEGNDRYPALSHVELDFDTRLTVEVLKRFARIQLIAAPEMKLAEVRGREIVESIFDRLARPGGQELLPADFRRWHLNVRKKRQKMRVICDFVAGMTDRYAAEFYARLRSDAPQSIFKPV
jgi:dGTPase